MSKTSDKSKGRDDNNDSLVMALESIKTLLASGGKKRAEAAAETEIIKPAEPEVEVEPQSEPEVPVLDNIIIPGHPVSEEVTAEEPTPPPSGAEQQNEINAGALAAFQAQLEHELHDKLSNYVGQLEQELKQRIAAFIQAQQKK